ncbi:MAG: 5'/3'-nucleotidase SurE [Candidatus Kariarchaeaceae archaeon]|jgi:5'-nucleotidase
MDNITMGESNIKILVGNDDGVISVGIDILSKYAKEWGNVTIVAPETQQSAKAKSLTFDKPIRLNHAKTDSGIDAYAYNASPADSMLIYQHLEGRPDVVLSGINAGDNTSIHSILTSGTCAVAMEAGLKDIPAFAFSLDAPEEYFFGTEMPYDINQIGKISITIAKAFLEGVKPDFWEKVIFVNVNFPDTINEDTKLVVVELETYKYNNYLIERIDPKGENYYWLWGDKRDGFDKNKDCYKLYKEKYITITPVSMIKTDYLFNESKRIVENISW